MVETALGCWSALLCFLGWEAGVAIGCWRESEAAVRQADRAFAPLSGTAGS